MGRSGRKYAPEILFASGCWASDRRAAGAEIAAAIADDVFYYLDAPCGRVNNPNVPLPFSPALEFPLIPSAEKVYEKVKTYFK